MDREKRKIDDLFSEYDIKLRNWILDKLRDDATLYSYLISSVTDDERHPASMEKYLAESISNIRKFLQTLWPRKGKRGRRVEVEVGWFKPKDKEKMCRHEVMSTKKGIDYFYKILYEGSTILKSKQPIPPKNASRPNEFPLIG